MTYEERITKLQAQREQLIANVNAIGGQIQLLEDLIKERDAKPEEKPDGKEPIPKN